MTIFNLIEEPAADAYRELVSFAASQCSRALLVVRPGLGLGACARQVITDLEPFIASQTKSARWPGTELLDGEADLYQFRIEPEVTPILKAATDRLYGWCQPELPEDLCFLRENLEPWLTTIAHEKDGFLELSSWEHQQLKRALPGLKLEPDSVGKGA